jgi:GxxExxY protein
MNESEIARIVVDSIFQIHKNIGPGLLESVYETCLEHELTKRGLFVERQRPWQVVYDGVLMEVGFRFDLVVERKVIIEIKLVLDLAEVYYKQVLIYLKIADIRLGFLVNFNVPLVKDGIHRLINGTIEP